MIKMLIRKTSSPAVLKEAENLIIHAILIPVEPCQPGFNDNVKPSSPQAN
jgi:hypothetical protein